MITASGLLPRRDKRPWSIEDFVPGEESHARPSTDRMPLEDQLAMIEVLKAMHS